MKSRQLLFFACAMPVLLLFSKQVQAQPPKYTYTFYVYDINGEPIKGAKLQAPGSADGYTDEDGMLVYRVPNGYVTITAAGYKRILYPLQGITFGSVVNIPMTPMAPEIRHIKVYVKDKNNKPVKDASISVLPGSPGQTDAQGYAYLEHKQMIGDYVTLIVSANGYKTQQQRMMVGENRKTSSIRTPDDEVFITMQSDKLGLSSLTIEVLDSKTDEPIAGASVKLQVINGANAGSSTTGGNGEASFGNLDLSSKLRVMVKRNGYKENWSDVTEDLMDPGGSRRFTVYLEPEAAGRWSGVWMYPGNATQTTTISGDPPGSGHTTYQVSGRKYICTVSFSNFVVTGNTAKYTWTGHYEDDDKTVERKGTGQMTLNGDSITVTDTETDDTYNWKKGVSPYSSAMQKGAVWNYTLVRKK